jgi:AraC-like DNA-binding protein
LIELADELGYGNHSNFTRFFTQHVGVSPSEFRRQTITTLDHADERGATLATPSLQRRGMARTF